MKEENLPWKKAAILICTKCGKSIDGVPKEYAEVLKKEIKGELKELGLAKDIRVMTSSCLDICEEGYQAIAIIPNSVASKAIVKVVNPFKDIEELKKEIKRLN